MQTVIQKWGNSLGIRIPRLYVKEFDLRNGSPVDITEEEGKLIIRPQKETLEKLLEKIAPENLHEEISFGNTEGYEEW
jgi:antitoxin MazE